MNKTFGQTRAMFIGTCRMHDPAKFLKDDEGLIVRATPHRFHTPTQTLQFVRHMGGDPQYRTDTMHLVSDYAAAEIFENATARNELINRLKSIANLWKSFHIVVIEICALREFVATLGRSKLTVNTFAERDQERYADQITREASEGLSVPVLPIKMERLTAESALRLMIQIKAALAGRPVIWVSHQRPPDLPQYEIANKVRRALAHAVKAGAEHLGDRFFDPTEVAREMGAEAFFKKNGTDIDHMTSEAAKLIAMRYRHMILEERFATKRQVPQ